ncbi:MAG: DUF3592 domain-containing protein [Anaerolineae bacterium]|nr:DUF3592 domain-containing protein [Anaerolineae bacterium]
MPDVALPILGCAFPLIAMVYLYWAQSHSALPQSWQKVHWAPICEIGLAAFLTFPMFLLLYGLLLALAQQSLLIDLGVGLIGLSLLLVAVDRVESCRRYHTSEQWPTTWGTVLQFSRRRVRYTYLVEQTRYYGQRIDAQHAHHLPLIQRHHPLRPYRQEVIVYYHPQEPQRAVLVPGVNWSGAAVLLGSGVACLMLPLLALWLR